MEPLAAARRTMSWVLALLPAIVVAACARLATLGQPPLAERAAAAAAVAVAAWTAYRLLTAKLELDTSGVTIRGVYYEAHVPWRDVEAVTVRPANPVVRALVWGVLQPHGLEIRAAGRTLRPLVALGHPDDEDLQRVLGVMRARMSVVTVPAQRSSDETVSTA
jgi:hypothetical protein